MLPARGGDVAKIYLAKHSIPNSTYPAVTSSFFVESLFDTTIGALVMLFALTQGVLPSLPQPARHRPRSTSSFWADHPRFALFTITFITVGLLVLYAVLSIRAVVFWRRVRQGVVILTDFRRYLRQVAAWQAAAWLLRFFSFYFFLEAFNIGGSVENALLVMSVQALSTLTPFTPGGAGAQQALLVYVFRGKASRTAGARLQRRAADRARRVQRGGRARSRSSHGRARPTSAASSAAGARTSGRASSRREPDRAKARPSRCARRLGV